MLWPSRAWSHIRGKTQNILTMDNPNKIRASSFWVLLDCAYRWYIDQILKLRKPVAAPAAIGTAVHRSTGAYDQAKLAGEDVSIDEAAGEAVDSIMHPEEEVDWLGSGVSQKSATDIAVICHTKYCSIIAPTRKYAAVETTLKPLAVKTRNGVVLEFTGTLDRVREEQLEVGSGSPTIAKVYGVDDIKTGARAVDSNGKVKISRHGPQVGLYSILGEHTHNIPMMSDPGIIGLQTSSQARVGYATIPNARKALIGTQDYPGLIDHVSVYFQTGLFPPNPGSILCSEKYCSGWDVCPYHE